MKVIFGLDFKNDSGEGMQFAVDTETEEVRVRVSQNGQWRAWQRIDVKRTASGELDETVWQAKRAETADHFTSPIKFVFGGAMSGEVKFDGSTKDVAVDLGVGPMTRNAISSAMQAHISAYHSGTSGDGYGGGNT